MKALLTVAAVAGLLAITVTAWGPSSHYYFTCTASDIPLDECLTQANEDLLSGTEMPDAFYFVDMVTDSSLPCHGSDLKAFHSPIFAGYLYQEAPHYNSATFNATAFAIGFGMHVAADGAGFFFGGYLGSGWGHGVPPLNNTNNWLSLWSFMGAVDAHVYNDFFRPTGTHLPRRGVPSSSLETANFVVSTVQKALANGTQFPNIDAARVQQCAAAWQAIIAEESIKAEATPPAAFEFVMTYNDRYNATNWNQSKSHFDKVRGCAVEAPRQWLQAMERPGATPQQAYDALKAYLVAAFFSGMCTP